MLESGQHDHALNAVKFWQALILGSSLESCQSALTLSDFNKSSKNHTMDCKA